MRKLKLREEKWWVSAASKQEWSPGPPDSKACDFFLLYHRASVWLSPKSWRKIPLKIMSKELPEAVLSQSRVDLRTGLQWLVVKWMRETGSGFSLRRLLGEHCLGKGARSSLNYHLASLRWFSRGSAHRLRRNLHAESAALNFHGRKGGKGELWLEGTRLFSNKAYALIILDFLGTLKGWLGCGVLRVRAATERHGNT